MATKPALSLVLPETPSLALVETKRLAAMPGPVEAEKWFGAFYWQRHEHATDVLRVRAAIGYGEGVRT